MSQSKRKWKVYTSNELRDRFQPKPGSVEKDEKVNVPNLSKRRNSAPPGMIHFPPGTFSSHSNNNNNNNNNNHGPSLSPRGTLSSSPSSPNLSYHLAPPSSSSSSSSTSSGIPTSPSQQHHLITKAPIKATVSGSPYPPPNLHRRRSSLPHILNPPPSSQQPITSAPHTNDVPSIEHYFQHLQNLPKPIDFNNADRNTRSNFAEEVKAYLCTTSVERQILPSFQALLQTITEEREEEDNDEELSEYHENRVNEDHPDHDHGYFEIDLSEEDNNSVPSASALSTRQSMEISQILSHD